MFIAQAIMPGHMHAEPAQTELSGQTRHTYLGGTVASYTILHSVADSQA